MKASRQRNGLSSMRVGRTIAEERERLESESERIEAREKAKNRQTRTVLIFAILIVVVFGLVGLGIKSLADNPAKTETGSVKYEPTVEIIDESGAGITNRTREFIGMMEQDFKDLGYTMTRAAVPAGKRREVDAYVDGVPYYIKMNVDRGSAVSVEDADRMIKYLNAKGIVPGYLDVRVEGKAYYK